MTSANATQNKAFQRISQRLVTRDDVLTAEVGGRTRASVALILCQSVNDLEILFIQRAKDDLDPWSGHIAFPGGKLEAGEQVCQAARRETREEIGLDLEAGCYLGRLSDIVGANLPVHVSCCVFGMDREACEPSLSDEVSDVFWASLSDLRDSARHLLADVAFDDRRMAVPAIRLPHDGKPVLWGITYRLLMQFIELFDRLEDEVDTAGEGFTLPATMELDYRK